MPTYDIEGQNATIAFGSSSFPYNVISITAPGRSRAEHDTTHLGTSVAKTYKPAKLIENGTYEIEFDHAPAGTDLLLQPVETVTISYPLESGQTTPVQKTFTAFCTQQGGEEFKVDSLMRTKVTLRVSGVITTVAAT